MKRTQDTFRLLVAEVLVSAALVGVVGCASAPRSESPEPQDAEGETVLIKEVSAEDRKEEPTAVTVPVEEELEVAQESAHQPPRKDGAERGQPARTSDGKRPASAAKRPTEIQEKYWELEYGLKPLESIPTKPASRT